MWHRDGPTFLTDNVWVGISFDGTKLWQASFVHFAVGDLGSHMPLGSWILLRGSEKKAIISQLADVYDLNADLTEVAQQQIPDKGGYLRKVICFFIADTKAQVILGGCSSFTAKNPAATVCWLCGKNRATSLHEFGCGRGVIVEEWLWAGMICPIVRPAQRPLDYGLHGVHRQVHNGLSKMGEAHKACEMNVTLWAHLWIDHLLGWARRWGHIAIFAAFKGEGRHKALKCEISKRSFRGGSKGGRVSSLRGATVRVKGGKGDRTRKGWGEVIRSDNLDWGLYNKKFSVWESSWTKQRGYIENKGVFVQAEQGM